MTHLPVAFSRWGLPPGPVSSSPKVTASIGCMLPKLPTACLRAPSPANCSVNLPSTEKAKAAPVGIDRAEGLFVAGRLDQAAGKSQMRALPRQSGHPFRAEFLGRCPGGRTAHRRGCHKKDESAVARAWGMLFNLIQQNFGPS
jgi:hypothetical protein